MDDLGVNLRDIYLARRRISQMAEKTPLIFSPPLSQRTGRSVFLKLECLQETGSFKVRGAVNKLLTLSDEEKSRGVVAFSTGNHGRAVAHVARRLGIPALVCLSKRVPAYRVDAMKRLGAEVVLHGASQDEAYEYALELRKERGLTMINPFDDPYVIAGQGTIGLEIMEDLPEVGMVLVPVSGGGLISGIGLVLKGTTPGVNLIGISMDRSPAMYHSLKAGRPVEVEEKDSLADALLGGIGLENQYTFRMVQEYVDDLILVSEEEIAGGIFYALVKQHLVVEGAGAVGLSALLHEKVPDVRESVVVVVSGSNVDTKLLTRIASKPPAMLS